MPMKMKDCERNERPREKAMRFGLESLSDAELLCLLLGSGGGGHDLCQIAENLLEKSSQLARLGELSYPELLEIEGIGPAKALLLQAAFELNRRALRKQSCARRIESTADAAAWMQAEYGSKSQEHFAAVYLNTKGEVIRQKVLFVGTLNRSLVHPRDIFREAFLVNAASVLFVHNHPSNDPTPSRADFQTTLELQQAANVCQIELFDHLIVGKNTSYSFRDYGLLD